MAVFIMFPILDTNLCLEYFCALILLVSAGKSGSIKYEQICDSTIKMCYVLEFIISKNFGSKISALHVALFYEEVS